MTNRTTGSRFKVHTGYSQWVAPKSVFQPPFAVRWKNKWWRAAYEYKDALHAAFEPLDFGHRRLLDYLDRTRQHFNDLPVLPMEALNGVR